MRKRGNAATDGHGPSQPTSARLYDYLLGGSNNFSVDRSHGDRIITSVPEVPAGVHAQRAVMRRVTRYLVADAGIRQLIDIGTGLPARDNVNEVAQRIDPETRVVCVDNDPVVVAHARAWIANNPATVAIQGDLRHPAGITGDPVVRGHLDWNRPIGLLLCGVLIHIMDDEGPAELMAALIDTLPSGSYVFIQHLLDVDVPAAAHMKRFMVQALGRIQFRTMDQVRELFGGLEFVEPGLVPVPQWRPDEDDPARGDQPGALGLACAGLARKP